ncbi:hypothetical protein BASA62_003167 [Batrachochytrium salamandrivorans]|nr:hypothetical protein BASA62_003167 [Batrachochytrium salamandrivorans]
MPDKTLALPIGGISRRDYTSLSTLALNSIGPSSSLAGTAVAGSISQQRRISLQDKLMYFSPGDSEIAGEISQMLLTHGNTAFKSSHEADSRPDSISIQLLVMSLKTAHMQHIIAVAIFIGGETTRLDKALS